MDLIPQVRLCQAQTVYPWASGLSLYEEVCSPAKQGRESLFPSAVLRLKKITSEAFRKGLGTQVHSIRVFIIICKCDFGNSEGGGFSFTKR